MELSISLECYLGSEGSSGSCMGQGNFISTLSTTLEHIVGEASGEGTGEGIGSYGFEDFLKSGIYSERKNSGIHAGEIQCHAVLVLPFDKLRVNCSGLRA